MGQSAEREPQTWIKLTTPKFELYTDTSSTKAKNLLSCSSGRGCHISGSDTAATGMTSPLRIIAFANGGEYEPFRLKAAAVGHYLHSRDRDYVVLSDAEPEHFEAAVHEYTHYAVNRAALHLPRLNEGVADLYSTTAVNRGTPLLGAPLAGRLSTLKNTRLISLREIFGAGRTSSLYNSPKITPLFYAESWLFTRLLALDARYTGHLLTLPPGRQRPVIGAMGALEHLWHDSGTIRSAELPAYLLQVQGGGSVTTAALIEQAEPGEMVVSEFERRLIWADLLAAHPATAARGKEQLLELEASGTTGNAGTAGPHRVEIETFG